MREGNDDARRQRQAKAMKATSRRRVQQRLLTHTHTLKHTLTHTHTHNHRSSAAGWRGADWTEEVWQGLVKVVERGDKCAIILTSEDNVTFAVCPYKEGAVDRCIDSSRYFVLRIENAQGRHMFIGLAFNERNDAFDFNTSLEDSRREREQERNPPAQFTGPSVDYSLKEGQKIRVAVPKIETKSEGNAKMSAAAKRRAQRAAGKTAQPLRPGGLLAPSSRDTPGRRMEGGGGGLAGGLLDAPSHPAPAPAAVPEPEPDNLLSAMSAPPVTHVPHLNDYSFFFSSTPPATATNQDHDDKGYHSRTLPRARKKLVGEAQGDRVDGWGPRGERERCKY